MSPTIAAFQSIIAPPKRHLNPRSRIQPNPSQKVAEKRRNRVQRSFVVRNGILTDIVGSGRALERRRRRESVFLMSTRSVCALVWLYQFNLRLCPPFFHLLYGLRTCSSFMNLLFRWNLSAEALPIMIKTSFFPLDQPTRRLRARCSDSCQLPLNFPNDVRRRW